MPLSCSILYALIKRLGLIFGPAFGHCDTCTCQQFKIRSPYPALPHLTENRKTTRLKKLWTDLSCSLLFWNQLLWSQWTFELGYKNHVLAREFIQLLTFCIFCQQCLQQCRKPPFWNWIIKTYKIELVSYSTWNQNERLSQ